MNNPKRISFLYTNIGRGHPAYLDGIVESIRNMSNVMGIEIGCDDVQSTSRGLAKLAWKFVHGVYRRGGANGLSGKLYNRIRQNGNYHQGGVAIKVLGRDIRRRFATGSNPIVVAHPLLVGILHGRPNLIYQHGELVVPREVLVPGAATVLVPTVEVQEKFVSAGYESEQVIVTGLCIEPGLLAKAGQAYRDRVARIAVGKLLTGLFLTSGAEPSEHITRLISSITSCVRGGLRVLVVARSGGKLEAGVIRLLRNLGEGATSSCALHTFVTRAEENDLIARVFGEVDFLVAPPHERTNWALGLGLPMFALTPTIGSFAPLNLRLLLRSGTTVALDSRRLAENLVSTIAELSYSGRLGAMADAGWGRYEISGFEVIARHLLDNNNKLP